LRAASATDQGAGRARLEEDVLALFDQFRDPLLRYLSSIGLALPDGEEVLQEVFISLFQHLDRGKSRDNLRGWLFRVAHNLALKRRYRTRRDLKARALAGAEDRAIDPGPSPEERMANRQTRERLLAVAGALPEQDRWCLFLRAEGWRYREIAEILGMSLGAVSMSLSRSLGRIARFAQRCHNERNRTVGHRGRNGQVPGLPPRVLRCKTEPLRPVISRLPAIC
jgi:RNA polymerase sigma-70 factor (ECF subfamily)